MLDGDSPPDHDAELHTLAGSSRPTGEPPRFDPVATAPVSEVGRLLSAMESDVRAVEGLSVVLAVLHDEVVGGGMTPTLAHGIGEVLALQAERAHQLVAAWEGTFRTVFPGGPLDA